MTTDNRMDLPMRLIALIVASLLLISCSSERSPFGSNKYEAIVHAGKLYVLNTKTGVTERIDGDTRILITQSSLDSLSSDAHIVRSTRNIGDQGVIELSIISKIVADTVKVRGTISPHMGGSAFTSETLFSIDFFDADSFRLGSIVVTASDLLTVQDHAGQPDYYSFQKDTILSPSAYREASSHYPTWGNALDTVVTSWLKSDAGEKWQEAQQKSDESADASN